MRNLRLALAMAVCTGVGAASASDLVNFTTVANTDWAQAGVGGLRGVGTGSIALSGVSGTVSKAYLYWHGPTGSDDPLANASVNFGGTDVIGANIGFSDDNFWGLSNSQAYRADVTSLVSGNGDYALAGFRKDSTIEINGVSLIVFYDDGDSANNRDVVLFNGNDANFDNAFDASGWNATLSGINYSGGLASISMHVSDGQNFSSFDDGDLLLNGSLLASGGIFQGDSTPFSTGGVANGKLWDIKTFDVTSFLAPGSNSLSVTMASENDALSLVAVIIDLPVGAAPPIPEPGNWALMLAGLLGLTVAVRGKRRARS
jgi:Protein of unknown function (DUF3344)